MKGSDCVLLFLCIAAIWWSLPSSSSLSIIQKWKIPFDVAKFRNAHFPEDWEKLPPPIVSDVNGDGIKDIVYVNTNFEVNICDGRDIKEMEDFGVFTASIKKGGQIGSIPELKATYSASLLPEFGISFGRRPVALATGYIDVPSTYIRQQVIVVLTEGWVVLCYDFKLNLMWESNPVPEPNPDLYHKEASIVVSHTPLTNGDRGLIIVGGRKDKLSSELSHEHFDKEDFVVEDVAEQQKLQKIAAESIVSSIPGKIRRPLQFDEDPVFNIPAEDAVQVEDAKLQEGSLEDNLLSKLANELPDPSDGKFKQIIEDLKAGKEKFMEKLKEAAAAREQEIEEEINDARENENHFSFYAFEGHTGALRWKHEPGDFIDNFPDASEKIEIFGQATSHSATPDSAFKLHLFHNIKHLGEVNWKVYENDVKKALPSIWRTKEDTSMSIAHFEKRRSYGTAPQSVSIDDENWLTGDVFDGIEEITQNLIYQTKEDTIEKPNVVVVKNNRGVEVLHLYSGRPLCALELVPENLYADINNDGVIDKVETIIELKSRKSADKKNNQCLAIATSGVPTTIDKLFEKGVCAMTASQYRINKRIDKQQTQIDMAHPTAIPAGNGKSNLIFLSSNGRITCLNSEGSIVWQTDSNVKWSQVDPRKKSSARFAKIESFLEMGGFPSIQPFALYGFPHYLLAVGYHSLVVVHYERGTVEIEAKLPSIVNGPPVIGDWDTDGDNDVIVPCINGFVGLRVTKGSGNPIFVVLFGILLFAIPVLYITHKPSKLKPPKQPKRSAEPAIL